MTVGITELPPEGMLLPGVALAGDAERGTKTTEGISLLFTTAGVTVQGPQPQIERLLVWSALDTATCREKIQEPDGRETAILELTSGGQSIRFLLPGDTVSPGQAAYLDQALPSWLVRYKGATAPTVPAPIAPGVEATDHVATDTLAPEVGVALPAPGPAQTAPQPASQVEAAVESPAPAYAAAGATSTVIGAAGQAGRPSGGPSDANGHGGVTGAPVGSPPAMQPTALQAPPAPVAPPAPPAPLMQSPPPPPPPAPAAAAPVMQAPPPPTVAPAQTVGPAATAWDDPPLGAAAPADIVAEPKKAKKPRFALTRKQLRAAEAAAAGTVSAADMASVETATPAPAAPTSLGSSTQLSAMEFSGPTTGAPKAKKPKFALTRKQLRAAEAKAAGTDVTAPIAAATVTSSTEAAAAASAPTTEAPKAKKPKFALTRKQLRAAEAAAAGTAVAGGATAAATATATPTTTPVNPVPLAVQPPAPTVGHGPVPAAVHPAPPSAALPPPEVADGSSGVVLADAGSKSSRRNLVVLVVLLVVVVAAGAGYLISKKGSSTTTPSVPPVSSTSVDTALAASINLRMTDLPAGWTVTPPAQAVVRPPVAPAAAHAAAANVMASCLNTSAAVVSSLFDGGTLPGRTSMVPSRMFQSAAGSSFEMASSTATVSSAGQVQVLDAVFANPNFDACYQQFRTALVRAAVPGGSVQVTPVKLTAPTGVRAFGEVSTYTLPGSGTEVVGDAYILGGRTVTVLQPSTNGPAIPSDVFAPAFNAVATRASASIPR